MVTNVYAKLRFKKVAFFEKGNNSPNKNNNNRRSGLGPFLGPVMKRTEIKTDDDESDNKS